MSAIAWRIQARPHLELPTWPRFCPVSLTCTFIIVSYMVLQWLYHTSLYSKISIKCGLHLTLLKKYLK